MPPKTDPVPRARSALQWLGGLFVLGLLAGLVVAAAMALWQNVDVQSLARHAAAVGETPPSASDEGAGPVAAATGPAKVAVLESAASATFFPDSSFYERSLSDWTALAAELDPRPLRVRGADGIDSLPPASVLLAPEAVCLSRAEIAALRRHLRRGGGLVLNWATGVRDESCRWRGWEPVRALTGAIDLAEYPAGESRFLTVPAGHPLAAGLPPGARVELYAEPHVGLRLPGPRLYWSDWALNAYGGDGGAPDAAAALFAPESGGRVAWFGFRERDAASGRDAARVHRILRNGLLWAAGVPSATLAAWPGARQGALVVAEDAEAGFENAGALARLLRERNLPGTFFAVSHLALEHPELGDSLAAAGEIASQTADHVSPAGLPLGEQEIRLRRSVEELEDWGGTTVRGLRPPEERFDLETLRAWRRLGGTYVAAVNDSRSAAPEIFRTEDGPVVLVPRVLKDDYNVFVQDEARRTAPLLAAWVDGLRKVGALGGLAYLNVHTQIAGTPERLGVVGSVIDSARADPAGWWEATGQGIASWWLARSEARLALAPDTSGVLRLRVRVPTDGLDDAWADVVLPSGEDRVPEDAATGRRLAWAPTTWGIRFPLGSMPPGTDRTILLVPPESDGGGDASPLR